MVVETKPRHLSYRRAVWLKPHTHGGNLQALIMDALEKLPLIENTRVKRGEQILELRHRIKEDKTFKVGALTMLHIAAYTPKDAASTVPMTQGTADSDLSSLPPPAGQEFLDGDIMAVVFENDVCLCTSNSNEIAFYIYIFGLLRSAGYAESELGFEIRKVANRAALKNLVASGVRQIQFDFVAYQESINAFNNKPAKKLGDYLSSMFSSDSNIEELLDREGIQVNLNIKADGRVQNGAAQNALGSLAQEIVEDDADGFVIETKGGDRITPSELSIRRPASIEKDAKTIRYAHAWQKLKDFYEYVVDNKLNEF